MLCEVTMSDSNLSVYERSGRDYDLLRWMLGVWHGVNPSIFIGKDGGWHYVNWSLNIHPGLQDVHVVHRLPDRLVIGEHLTIDVPTMEALPEYLITHGGLGIDRSGVRELGEGTQVHGTLSMSGMKHVVRLPRGLRVGRNLDMSHSSQTEVANVSVGGDLNMAGTRVHTLENVSVGGNLHLGATKITRLSGTEVGGNIIIRADSVHMGGGGLERIGVHDNLAELRGLMKNGGRLIVEPDGEKGIRIEGDVLTRRESGDWTYTAPERNMERKGSGLKHIPVLNDRTTQHLRLN